MLVAQKEDHVWIMGKGDVDSQDSSRKLNYITFEDDTINIALLYKSNPFFCTQSILSDSAGILRCYTNGIHLYNRTHEIMSDGADFHSATQFASGYPFPQAALLLPFPSLDSLCILIDCSHKNIVGLDLVADQLRYSIIDMSQDNGLGKVIEKKIPLLGGSDTLNGAHFVACRHVNYIER